MSLFRRAPREVYQVYGEDEYLEGQIEGAGREGMSAVAEGEAPSFFEGSETPTAMAESGSRNPGAASSVTYHPAAAIGPRGRGALAAIALLVAAVGGVAVLVVLNMRSGRPRGWTVTAGAPVRSSAQRRFAPLPTRSRRFAPPPTRSGPRRTAAVPASELSARGRVGSRYRVFSRGGSTRARAWAVVAASMRPPPFAVGVPHAIQPPVLRPRPAEQVADEFGFER